MRSQELAHPDPTTKKTAVFTIVSKNYLPAARCLMGCLRRWHPEFVRIVILADRIDGCFQPEQEDFELIVSSDLPIPDVLWFHFKYTILELNTAVKPYALEVIFDKYQVDKVLYFDPDVWVYRPLTPLLAMLDQASIVLTPHLTSSLDDEFLPNEFQIMQSGAYNLGFIAVAAGTTAFRFLRWWQRKVYNDCLADTARGLFVDQRWVDLVPGLFPGVWINRDPGYNVAYWNLPHRKIERNASGYTANGCPLYFFHFSGFDPDNPSQFSKHQNRYRLSDLGEARQLVEDYGRELFRQGYGVCKRWSYAFATFQNGVPIPNFARRREQQSGQMMWEVRDPFSMEGFRAFTRHWNEPVADSAGRPTHVTRLCYEYYRSRIDLQRAMPDVLGQHQQGFLDWMLTAGQSEAGLHPLFLAPIRAGVRKLRGEVNSARKQQRLAELAAQIASELPPICREILSNERSILRALRHHRIDAGVYVRWLNGPMRRSGQAVALSRLADRIYQRRPDVQASFPRPYDRDAGGFVRWFLTSGRAEYQLTEAFLQPMRDQWEKILYGSRNGAVRACHHLWFAALKLGARIQVTLEDKPAGSSAPETPPARPLQTPPDRMPEISFGVNLVGYTRSETGVGESVRSAALAARRVGIPVRIRGVTAGESSRQQDFRIGPLDNQFPFSFHVLHVNADLTPIVAQSLGKNFFAGKYTIGYWAWELEEFPDRWLGSFQHVQEVWTPSTFCQEAIARKSGVPVMRVPHCVEMETSSLGRSHFGLPADRFLFLVVFDVLSVFERKNPLAAVEAFKAAFGRSSNCQLVLKINNLDKRPSLAGLLRDHCHGYPVTIIDRVISRREVNALIQACDCLVSLHRSEGFGLTLAEAMYVGKPVIATAYSGNTDFTRAQNSFLVNYRMAPVGKDSEPYPQDCLWADPLIPDAAQQMRLVYDCPEMRHRVASAGQEFVRRHLSPEAVGKLMRERLEHLRDTRRVALLSAP